MDSIYIQKVDGKSDTQKAHDFIDTYFEQALNGCHCIEAKRSRKSKTHKQVKMIFGLMIEQTIQQAKENAIGVDDLLLYLINGNIPKGTEINKDFLHALMYTICPTFDENGEKVTLSKMDTKQAAELFERFRNIMAGIGIVIDDPKAELRR